jgi:hypothetical protein
MQGAGGDTFPLGEWAGTKGQSRRLEGFEINAPPGVTLEHVARVQSVGDAAWTSGHVGSRGESKCVEGFAT